MAVLLTCVLMCLGRQVMAWAIYLSFQIAYFNFFPPLLTLLAAILDLSMTTIPILPFGACYISIHKVYCLTVKLQTIPVSSSPGGFSSYSGIFWPSSVNALGSSLYC